MCRQIKVSCIIRTCQKIKIRLLNKPFFLALLLYIQLYIFKKMCTDKHRLENYNTNLTLSLFRCTYCTAKEADPATSIKYGNKLPFVTVPTVILEGTFVTGERFKNQIRPVQLALYTQTL